MYDHTVLGPMSQDGPYASRVCFALAPTALLGGWWPWAQLADVAGLVAWLST